MKKINQKKSHHPNSPIPQWIFSSFFYEFYLKNIQKHIPLPAFRIVDRILGLREKKEISIDENKKQIQRVLDMNIDEVTGIVFEKCHNPRVSIIIPIYNKWQFTYNCLKSIKKNEPKTEFEIIVIDNASFDDTSLMFEKIKNITYLKNDINLGFSKACNRGARNANGEYLLFLNNDTVAKKNWLDPLIDELDSNKNASIVGSKLLFPDNTIQHAGIGFASDKIPFHLFYRLNFNDFATNERKLFDAVTGASLMIRASDFFRIGGFDEQYINGLEDIDLCLKIKELKKEIVYRPDSVLYHYESMSDGRFDSAKENVKLFLNKWGEKITP